MQRLMSDRGSTICTLTIKVALRLLEGGSAFARALLCTHTHSLKTPEAMSRTVSGSATAVLQKFPTSFKVRAGISTFSPVSFEIPLR